MINLNEQSTQAPSHYSKNEYKKKLKKIKKELFDLQNQFFTLKKHSLLIIFQGVDTSGKDSTIRKVFSSMNPMGVNVVSFKKPTDIEKAHDFMWRIYPHFPALGAIQIFNRSHYEDVLMPQILGEKVALDKRLEYIKQTENHLQRHGTKPIKFFLHVSKEEQAKRINDRKTNPNKRYKYSAEDDIAAEKYHEYQKLYNGIINTATDIPWKIIPADNKWYRNYLVANEILLILKSMLDNTKE